METISDSPFPVNRIIHLSDGTKIQNYDSYQLITDQKGNSIRYNFSQYSYYSQMPPVTKISSIQDSAGRNINFIYENRDCSPYLVRVEQVIPGNSPKIIMTHSSDTYIESFTDALGRTTTYYLTGTSSQGNPTYKNYDIWRIDYPDGARTEYDYKDLNDYPYYDIHADLRVKTQKFYRRGESNLYRIVNYEMTDISGNGGITTVNDQTRIKKYIFNSEGHTSFEATYDLSNKLQKSVSYNYSSIQMLIIVNSNVVSSCNIESSRPSQVATVYGKPDGSNGAASTYQYVYDNWGNTTKITDPLGNITYMAYANTSSEKNLSSIDSRYQNAKYQNGFPANCYNLLLTKATLITAPGRSPQLNQAHYKYDGEGNLVTESTIYNSSCLDTVYTYDDYGNTLTKTDAKYNTINFAYSTDYESAYLTRVYKPDDTTLATYAYDFYLAKKTSATDPKGNSFSYTYDALGRLTRETLNNSDPKVGVSQVLVYDDAYSKVTLFYGNSTIGWQAGQIEYDSLFGKPILTQRKNTKLIVASTNPADLMVALNASVVPWTVIKKFDYDTNGRLKWEMDNLNHKTSYEYDPLDRVIKTTYPDGTFSTVQWDDRIATKTDAKNNQRIEKYDILDRLIEVTAKPDADTNYVTTYTYDSASKLIKIRNPLGAETLNHYDNLGRLVRTDYPQDGPNPMASEIYTYDVVGNLETKSQGARSKTIEYEFFAGYRIKKVTTQPDGKIVNYTYDNNDNLLTQTWPGGSYTYSNYDARNRAHSMTARLDSNTFNFNYDYDTFGRMTKINYPGRSNPVDYTYDDLDRLSTISGFVTSCGYDGDGKLTSMVYANGITNSNTYKTNNDQLERIKAGNQSTILDLNYTYDTVGNITQINGEKYEYDGLNRLTWAGLSQSNATNKTGNVWAYDGAGNFLNKAVYNNGTAQFNYSCNSDQANRMATMGLIGLGYDSNGACTSKVKGNDTWNYGYDSESRLTQVTKNGSVIENNFYDGYGMRIKKVNGGKTTYYFYSGVNCLMEYKVPDGIYTYYIYAGNNAIAEESQGVRKYNHKDHLGSTRSITDSAGMLLNRQEYEPYGSPKKSEIVDPGLGSFETVIPDRILGNPSLSNAQNILNLGWRWTAGMSYSPNDEYCEVAQTSTASGGRNVARIYDNGSGTWKGFLFGNRNVSLIPGKWYRISVKARITAGKGTKYAAAFLSYNYNDNLANKYVTKYVTWTAAELAGGSWVTKYVIFQVPLGNTYNTISPYLYGQYGGAGVVEYDDYRIEEFDSMPIGPPIDEVASNISEKYQFTGKDYDEDTGLIYFGARFYDPEIGRFITSDPAKQGLNYYSYCGNNPLRYTDPDGRWFGVDDVFTGPVDELAVVGLLALAATLGCKPAQDALQKIGEAIDEAWDRVKDGDTVVVDPYGNAIPLKEGERIEGPPDHWQVKDKNGKPTKERYDKGHPKQKDPKAKEPHGHRVGPNGKPVTDSNGNPHLPAYPASNNNGIPAVAWDHMGYNK